MMVKQYLSLVKFSHTIFALPFAMIGYTLAVSHSGISADLGLLVKVLLCMIFARSAAMAFNRYADRRIDEQNPRTAVREIPSGVIKPQSALLFAVVNGLLFIATTWMINPLCFALSPVALMVILGYSLTKRFTSLCHLILGLGLSLAPIGAYLAVTGAFNLLPILFSFTVLTWVSGFDIIYALQDEQFDKAHKLHSIPAALGATGALTVSRILHLTSAACVILAGIYGNVSWGYWVGAGFFCTMLVYQHTLVKPKDLSRVNLAFFTSNGIASLAFAAAVIADLIWLS